MGGNGYGKLFVIVFCFLHFPMAAWSSSVDSGVNSVVADYRVGVRGRVEVRMGVMVRAKVGFRD